LELRPLRTAWREFPDIVIHADEPAVRKHHLYAVAKAGDVPSARSLVQETVTRKSIERVRKLVGGRRPVLAPVHAVETRGVNSIPLALAERLSRELGLSIHTAVVQINTVGHTGADGYTRLAFPALFDGFAPRGDVLLLDDFIGQDGTLANLRGLLESQGATVIGGTTLTGKAFSAKLRLEAETLAGLRGKHGDALEGWWIDSFSYGFERLTESEARYLTRADDAHSISARIVEARRKRGASLPPKRL
jgi:hypothetical protein